MPRVALLKNVSLNYVKESINNAKGYKLSPLQPLRSNINRSAKIKILPAAVRPARPLAGHRGHHPAHRGHPVRLACCLQISAALA